MVRLSLEWAPQRTCDTVGKVSQTVSNALRAAPLAIALYLFGLTNVGLLSTDEPRYAAVSLEMSRSGDWVTPRLWGERWFEKPPLLYWLEAGCFRLGLGKELAPRLLVALLGLAFLGFYYRFLAREFGAEAAFLATAMLGTSVGWLAFSHVAVTDVPVATTFGAGMLLCLHGWSRKENAVSTGRAIAAGVLFGLAVLAKGLVPVALALPLARLARHDLKKVLLIGACCGIVATPWYVLCTARNGEAFLEEFIWKHHFQRFATDALAHTQPFWFYIPVLLAGAFPWTPALVPLFRKAGWSDRRKQFLLAWVVWGLVFFSASTAKLPGYLLPLLPPLFALAGIALAEIENARWILAGCALLLAAVPLGGFVLPQALAMGLTRAAWPKVPPLMLVPVVLIAVLCVWLESRGARLAAVTAISLGMAAGVVWITALVYPVLDASLTARPVVRPLRGHEGDVCLALVNRAQEYGLNYYLERRVPRCSESPGVLQAVNDGGRLTVRVVRAPQP